VDAIERVCLARRKMQISVVVLTHNRLHLLRQCVENVLSRTSRATVEIIVWDNASTDGTAGYLRSLAEPRLRVVEHPENIGQNAYAEAFRLAGADYFIELDDDMIDAPKYWDATLLDAFKRIPDLGFLAADLEDNPHDQAARVRWHERPEAYRPFELNGVKLLDGPTGGGCAITSRAVYEHVGGFKQRKGDIFWLEDAQYIKDIERLGYRKAILADLRVLHAGGPYYAKPTEARNAYWARVARTQQRKDAVKRALLVVPFVRRLNARYSWFVEPQTRPAA
jgi:GT2 family glycosyltransferase